MSENSNTLLQKLDCNCNDCFFMQRDFKKYNEALLQKKAVDLMCFNSRKQALINQAQEVLKMGENAFKLKGDKAIIDKAKKKFDFLTKEANNMKFQFENKLAAHYGNCTKKNIPVVFTPNLIQLDTQECFSHRKDHKS